MDFWTFVLILCAVGFGLAHQYNKNPHGFRKNLLGTPERKPKRQAGGRATTATSDDFLDRLEVKHSHEAQKALVAANNNDAPGALRWYSAALATAEMLYGCTQDSLWRNAIASYRSLVADYTRMVNTRRNVAVQRVSTPAAVQRVAPTTTPSIPAPVAPVTPSDPREALISKLIHQLHCDRATAESIADRQLAQTGKP